MAASQERHDPLVWLVLVLILLLVVPGVLMMSVWGVPMMGTFGTRTVSGAGWVAMGVAAVGVVLVVWLLFLAVGRAPHALPPPAMAPPMTGRDILDARYARGELSREDYLRMREDLEPKRP